MEHTQGKWRIVDETLVFAHDKRICRTDWPNAEANARLIAEAGTVANETGLTPRQLLEQRDDLVVALKDIVELAVDFCGVESFDAISKRADQAIPKTTKQV